MSNADLAGAVGDALAVQDWLVGPGGVPAGNVVLLASPAAHSASVAAGTRVTGEASRLAFAREVGRLAGLTDVGHADRLYVYFAGHGCGTDPVNAALSDDALVFSGFSEDDPSAHAIALRDLLAQLDQARFGEVVMFLDACRDFPYGRPFRPGGLRFDSAAGRGVPPRLYRLQSTLPGRRTYGGAFTAALLAGLAGAGAAKEFDERADRPYVVRWSTLTAYLESEMRNQEPFVSGRGDLVLADFADGTFGEVELTVSVAPVAGDSGDGLEMAVTYRDPSSFEEPRLKRPGPAPARFRVPPRRHRVTARTPSTWGHSAVDAYADTAVAVTLSRTLPDVVSGDRDPGSAPAVITTDDPAAAIMVTTPGGGTLMRGAGSVAGTLADGLYTVTVTDALGWRHREVLDVHEGSGGEVTLDLPNPPGGAERDGPLRWVGPAAAFVSSTPLFARPTEPGRPGRFVCVATDRFRATGRTAGGALTELRVESVADRWWWVAAPPEAQWLEVRFGDHRLELPAAPGLRATIELAATGLLVMYFDRAHLEDQASLVFVERAQRLMSAGRLDAADVVLGADRRRTALDGVLLGAHTPLRRLGRTAVAPGNRPYLLPGNQWGVLLDRPPHPDDR
ncbi:hypothetical protein Ait01nite_006640 [Actinoplanes italicus]|nr:hypothetical protein Ait01nite_006640 [Actinoplanes italicus]